MIVAATTAGKLKLAGWRRHVAELYATVRHAPTRQDGHTLRRAGRVTTCETWRYPSLRCRGGSGLRAAVARSLVVGTAVGEQLLLGRGASLA
jgi:hypothetical protein